MFSTQKISFVLAEMEDIECQISGAKQNALCRIIRIFVYKKEIIDIIKYHAFPSGIIQFLSSAFHFHFVVLIIQLYAI